MIGKLSRGERLGKSNNAPVYRPVANRNATPPPKTVAAMKNISDDTEGRLRFQRQMGLRLRMSRCLLDRNMTRFAQQFGVLTNRWRQWEEGNHPADIYVMQALCDRWGFTLEWLYRGMVETLEPALRARIFEQYPETFEEWRARSTRPPPPPLPVPEKPATGRRRTSRGLRLAGQECAA